MTCLKMRSYNEHIMKLSQFENIIGSAVRNIINKNMNIEDALRFIEVMYSTN